MWFVGYLVRVRAASEIAKRINSNKGSNVPQSGMNTKIRARSKSPLLFHRCQKAFLFIDKRSPENSAFSEVFDSSLIDYLEQDFSNAC